MMLAFVRVAPGASILALLVLAAIVLAGLVGLALLVIGLVKRWPGMWIGGIVVMLIAGLVLAAGVAAAFVVLPRACTVSPGPPGLLWHAPDIGPPGAGPAEGGDYVRHSGDRGAARVEGVHFEVIQPGSGVSRSSSSHTSGIGGSESKHELTLGEVTIVVKKRNGRTDFSVNGMYCGPVDAGDSVVINERREVTVNGQRRGQGQE